MEDNFSTAWDGLCGDSSGGNVSNGEWQMKLCLLTAHLLLCSPGVGDPCPRVMETKAKIDKWALIKLKNLLYSKGNHKQNEKITYGMGENICKGCLRQGLNFQNIETAHAAKYQKEQTTQSKNGKTT